MFYGQFGTQNSRMTFIFKFYPIDEMSNSGQTRSNKIKLQNSKFSYQNMPIMCSFIPGFPKSHYFYVRQLEIPKNAFKTCDVILFTCFLAITLPKTKILLWNLVCLFVCASITYIPFFITWKFWINRQLFLKNWNWKFSGPKSKHIINPRCHFVERLVLRHFAFFNCVLLQK